MNSAIKRAARAAGLAFTLVLLFVNLAQSTELESAVSKKLSTCPGGDDGCLSKVKLGETYRLAIRREQLFVEGEQAQLNSYSSQHDHLMASLWSQLVVGWVLLIAVILISFAGIAMSWHQLQHSLKRDRPTDTSMQLGKDGVKLDSPIIGLVIFIVSTLFFYLYIANVYPISLLGQGEKVSRHTVEKAASAPPN